MREYEAATRAHDLERTLGLIDENAVYWFSDGTSYSGKDRIGRALRSNFEPIEAEDYRIEDLMWLAESHECAACKYRFEWSGMIAGSKASGSGRGTSVLARRGESWVVVHEHLSVGRVG